MIYEPAKTRAIATKKGKEFFSKKKRVPFLVFVGMKTTKTSRLRSNATFTHRQLYASERNERERDGRREVRKKLGLSAIEHASGCCWIVIVRAAVVVAALLFVVGEEDSCRR